MTVESTTIRKLYTGTASTDTYAYTWQIYDSSELTVIERLIATGAETTLVNDTDYTVTGVGDEGGGTVVLDAGNLPATKKLLLLQNLPYTQTTSLPYSTALSATVLEQRFDKNVKQLLQLQELLGRTLVLTPSTDQSDIFIEDLEADKYLRVNTDGDGIEMVETISPGSITFSNRGETWVGLSTAANQRTAIELILDSDVVGWPLQVMADGGAADAYEITPSPAITAYASGQGFYVKIGVGNDNTGASTIDVNALGAKDIKLMDGNDPAAGQLLAGQICELVYDGTNFQLLNPIEAEKLVTGTYTGNDGATKALTGFGFEPKYIQILRKLDGSGYPIFKSADMGIYAIVTTAGADWYKADHIISFDPDGVTLGDGTGSANTVNVSPNSYYFRAWG